MVVTRAEFNKLAPNVAAVMGKAGGLKGRRRGYKLGS